MNNRVKSIRTKLGISQKELAEAAGTSQQQIHRIENNKIATKLETAIAICKALAKPLDVVFPGSIKAIAKMEEELQSGFLPANETYSAAAESGVEADARVWHFKFLLRGHSRPLSYSISAAEYRRLFSAVQQEQGDPSLMSFVVIDTESARVAINLASMVYCHFLFDVGIFPAKPPSTDPDRNSARIYFDGIEPPLTFGVEADRGDEDDEDDAGDFRNIFYALETSIERHERLRFEDEDGEDVMLRAGDLALLEVPLWVVDRTAAEECTSQAEDAP